MKISSKAEKILNQINEINTKLGDLCVIAKGIKKDHDLAMCCARRKNKALQRANGLEGLHAKLSALVNKNGKRQKKFIKREFKGLLCVNFTKINT